ncbi:hypothetical protein [Salinicoccus sp. HZC-1]|uniref:hypothetical protein n=1 Tax=Salinicoccus sp. HZC-1 TaxID=3385497 RepID=UPI00398AD76B
MTENKPKTAANQAPGEARLKLAAAAMAANRKLHMTKDGGDKGSTGTEDERKVEAIIKEWAKTSKMSAETIIGFYGPPNEATPSRLLWFYNGQWKRTVVYRDQVPHDFPEPHVDMLEQIIDYQVPEEKMGDLAQIEGSLIIDRTKGEVGVHCDNEGANILSINMMHEVVEGKRTPQEAREFISKELVEYLMGRPAPYAENFQFELPEGEQWFTDETTVDDQAMKEAVGKAKEKLGLDKEEK